MTVFPGWAELVLRFAAGAVLGCIFYFGLWLTVRRLTTARHPAAFAMGSLAVRLAITLAAVVLLIGGRWWNLVAIFGGFESARIAIVRMRRCT